MFLIFREVSNFLFSVKKENFEILDFQPKKGKSFFLEYLVKNFLYVDESFQNKHNITVCTWCLYTKFDSCQKIEILKQENFVLLEKNNKNKEHLLKKIFKT